MELMKYWFMMCSIYIPTDCYLLYRTVLPKFLKSLWWKLLIAWNEILYAFFNDKSNLCRCKSFILNLDFNSIISKQWLIEPGKNRGLWQSKTRTLQIHKQSKYLRGWLCLSGYIVKHMMKYPNSWKYYPPLCFWFKEPQWGHSMPQSYDVLGS